MKIGKYISELLFENDFVILPDLGEFSTKYIPAKFIPELKKVESPSKVITFNEKNKSGGGLLIEYIARKEQIGSQQAREFVTNFVAEMKNSLKSGKKVELENIGKFSMDQSGVIVFDPDKSVNYLNDSIGMSSVKEPAKKSEEEAKTELDKVIENARKEAPPVKDEKPAETEKSREAEKQDEKKEEKKPEAASQPVASPSGQKAPGTPTPLRTFQEPVNQKSSSSQSKEEEEKRTRSGGLPPALKWVAFTVVPLLIIIIVLAFNYEYIFGDKSVFTSEDPVVTETVMTETAEPEAATEPEPVVEEAFDPTVAPPAPESGRPVYYIIVGSFEEEHSALILAEELRTKGARTASVFPVNRLGFYRVSYGYYYDLQEAERELQKAKEIHPNAWVLHR